MITYILIGVVFMFLLEHFTSLKRFKKYAKTNSNVIKSFGVRERIIGILCWPVLLGVFSYNLIKELIK